MEKRDSKSGVKQFAIITAAVTASFVAIFIFFNIYFNKVYDTILEKDMEQIQWTSHYVTKLIYYEIEHRIEGLHACEESFHTYQEDYDTQTWTENLKDMKEKLDFERVGIVWVNGESVDDLGNVTTIQDPALFQAIHNDETYISNLSETLDNMLIAVPLHRNEQVIGALWGHFAVATIAQKIEMDDELHRYFQIVDDYGNYISNSGNIYSFAEDISLWEEMKRYEFTDDVTLEEIRQNVENGKSGTFHFRYQEHGRYVSYEPLGINNWYVFSVVVEDFIDDYVRGIEGIFAKLLFGLFLCVIVVVGTVNLFIYRTMRTIRNQSREMQVRHSLLSMILKQTNDILFELDILKNQMRVYHHSLEEEQVNYELIQDFSPEAMLENEIIRLKDYKKYKEFYEAVMSGGVIEPVILETKLQGKWDCNKIHALTVGKHHVIGFLEDYNEQMRQDRTIKEINRRSQRDSLTTLYSREYFVNEVERILSRYERREGDDICALFLLDLDHFKDVNDTLGHIAGDQVLRETGLILKSCIRSTDLAGRLGGDEFVLFIQNVSNVQGLDRCAKKLVSALKRTYKNEQQSITVSTSIGIVPVTTEKNFRELYEAADRALYQVKKAHRDGYKII